MNLLIICIFILNILLILQVIYYFKEFKSNSKKIKKLVLLIAFGFILLPFNSYAKGTMIIRNGSVIEQCSSCTSLSPTSEAFITNYRFILDSMSFTANNTYTFTLAYANTTLSGLSDVTDCGLNINGAYVTPQSRNSYRTWYSQSGNLYDSRFQTQIVYSPSSSLTSVPVFIQCDMSPALQLKDLMWAESHDDSGDNVTIAIQDQTNQIIIQNDYNANQNNANRDSNSAMIGGKIDNNTSVIGGKIDSNANTISGKIQQLIDNVTSMSGNIISGISSAISSATSTITQKVGELIGLSEVCEMYYNTSASDILNGDPNYTTGALLSDGRINTSTSFATSPYLPIVNDDTLYFYNNTSSNQTLYACFYSSNKDLLNCQTLTQNDTTNIYYGSSSSRRFVRYSFRITQGSLSNVKGQCHKSGIVGIFNTITQFFRNFKDFVVNLFNNTLGNVWNNININVAENTPVSDLLTLPLNFLRKLNSSLRTQTRSGSGGGVHDCVSYTIPFDFFGGNNTLTFPCLDLEHYLGSELWNLIDIALCGYIIINMGFMVIHFFESWTSFKDTFDELYQPAHGTYVPRHSGGDRGYFD